MEFSGKLKPDRGSLAKVGGKIPSSANHNIKGSGYGWILLEESGLTDKAGLILRYENLCLGILLMQEAGWENSLLGLVAALRLIIGGYLGLVTTIRLLTQQTSTLGESLSLLSISAI